MKLLDNQKSKYAYNINSTRNKKNIQLKYNFKGDYYSDILNSDKSLRDKHRLLSGIKTESIKESIYSNRKIPKVWKTRIGYQDEVYKAIDQDPEFAHYIGTSNKEKKENEFFETRLKQVSHNTDTSPNEGTKKFIPIDEIDKYIKHNDKDSLNINQVKIEDEKNPKNLIIETENIENSDGKKMYKEGNGKESKTQRTTQNNFYSKDMKLMNDKFISSKLDEFRVKYDMKKYMHNIQQKRIKEGRDHDLKIYVPNFMRQPINNYRDVLKSKTVNKKQNILKNNIYSNLIPSENVKYKPVKTCYNSGTMKLPKLKKNKLNIEKNKTTVFLNQNDEYDKPIEITNPKIKRDLELINYFGPQYSNCYVCRRRNSEFYQNSEPNQALILLNYLKKIKLNDILNRRSKNKRKK